MIIEKNTITIFTDGAARGNPGPGGWGAVVVSAEKVWELGGREAHTTNNRMELMAAIEALSSLAGNTGGDGGALNAVVYTDSNYLINGITKWVFGWVKKGWVTTAKEEVVNRDLWERLMRAVAGKKIDWKYVGGHVGIAGNERCDVIATSFADNKRTDLYNGSRAGYSLDILNISLDETKKKEKSSSRSRSGAKAFSYLSMVDGKVETHQSWVECESRVKGKSGAKFKKALSAEEEKEIIKSWGK